MSLQVVPQMHFIVHIIKQQQIVKTESDKHKTDTLESYILKR